MLERALDAVRSRLRDFGSFGTLNTEQQDHLEWMIEACTHHTPEFEERFGPRPQAPPEDDEDEDETGELTNTRGGL